MIWRIGKHKGEDVQEIPSDYLEYFAGLGRRARSELDYRDGRRQERVIGTWPFGAYQGQKLQAVPDSDLEFWAKWGQIACEELYRRVAVERADKSLVEQVYLRGHRDFAKQWHPDVGGSQEKMRDLNLAKEFFLWMLRNQL